MTTTLTDSGKRAGIIWLNDVLVTVDLQAFVKAAHAGDRARRALRPREAIESYRQALELYPGPLLAGREQAYGWVPDLQDRYARRQRQVTQRLAELLMQTGQYSAAAALWVDLMCDPGPPDLERDHGDQYEYREAYARAAFECCRKLRDVRRLSRVRLELERALEALNTEVGLDDAAELAIQTATLYDEIYAELASSQAAVVRRADAE